MPRLVSRLWVKEGLIPFLPPVDRLSVVHVSLSRLFHHIFTLYLWLLVTSGQLVCHSDIV